MRKKLFRSSDQDDENIGENDVTLEALEENLSFEIGDSEDEIKLNF